MFKEVQSEKYLSGRIQMLIKYSCEGSELRKGVGNELSFRFSKIT